MNYFGKRYIFVDVKERQEQPAGGIVYICDADKMLTLRCPCGCGSVIYLNLVPDIKPSWKVNGNSISPSIRRTVGCMSHFTITNGITHS